MRQSVAKEWVAALRSGEYNQGRNVLKNLDNTFCCLGVLCELYRKKNDDITMWFKTDRLGSRIDPRDGFDDTEEHFAFGQPDAVFGDRTSLPMNVMRWADMRTENGDLGYFGDEKGWVNDNDLASMNDGGMSFQDISKVIEENWENL